MRMKAAEAIAHFLSNKGISDVFGVPGGVILDLLYAFHEQPGITPHLTFHEQSAGFAACGYAQVSGKAGVVYATKGPGFTNLLTPVADAYYDSIPVLVFTAHSIKELPKGVRSLSDQEMDTCAIVRKITKLSIRIDEIEDLMPTLSKAYNAALSGRKGPVLLDVYSKIFREEIPCIIDSSEKNKIRQINLGKLELALKSCKRPLFLIGDGVNQAQALDEFNNCLKHIQLPVISSRAAHNVVQDTSMYFGYIGSHGIRYANFLLSKSDLLICIGNRLAFPQQSASFSPIARKASFFCFEIDSSEIERNRGIADCTACDLRQALRELREKIWVSSQQYSAWLDVCRTIREDLMNYDCPPVVYAIEALLKCLHPSSVLVCDVGNNEFWVSRACVHSAVTYRTLYSKSFGALGNALGKAIGVYYAHLCPVVVFIGDQGLQFNSQDLQYISHHRLPIIVVLLNNSASGMIRDREELMGYSNNLHTTISDGYSTPDFSRIASSYGIRYILYSSLEENDFSQHINSFQPLMVEIVVSNDRKLTPFLPPGEPCQNLFPKLDRKLYDSLNQM